MNRSRWTKVTRERAEMLMEAIVDAGADNQYSPEEIKTITALAFDTRRSARIADTGEAVAHACGRATDPDMILKLARIAAAELASPEQMSAA